jgi:hypothetical protein
MDWHLTRAAAAVEVAAAPPATSDDLELSAIGRQQRRFGRISMLAIVVSFVHRAAALVLFSRASLIEQAAALAMTLLVDIATWAIAEYRDYAKRRNLARSRWVGTLFLLALAISMFLNGAYLYANRPPASALPEWMSVGIAAVFALFVPALIGVASLIRGELEDDRLQLRQRMTHAVDLASEVISLRQDYDAAASALRQRASEDDARDREVRQITQERDAAVLELRQTVTQLETERATPKALPDAERVTLGGRPYSLRQAAGALDMSEATLRRKLARIDQEMT